VWDTQLLHKLFKLASEGHTAQGKGGSTLETCAAEYLGAELPKDACDSRGNPVRLSYDQYLNRPASEIEPIYLEYLARDTLATFLVQRELLHRVDALLDDSHDEWGFVSAEWLLTQVDRFGPLTHHIQLKAAIVLREITANGLGVDTERREELAQQLATVRDEHRAELLKSGYIPGQEGSGKALQEILRRLDAKYPEIYFPRTANKGEYATSEDALQAITGVEPFIDSLIAYRAVDKLLSTFLEKLGRTRVHPSFGVMVRTGRTSSFGELNAQNLPRDDRVRSCFVPSPGSVFIDADYSTIEMATLAQSVQTQLGIPSKMAEAINAGQDLHRLVSARFFGKPEHQVTKDERQKAKAINFGKPGAMGSRALKEYAFTSYGVNLTDDEVEALSESWLDLFPEMRQFLESSDEVVTNLATALDLTPTTYFEHTDRKTFLNHPNNVDREHAPHPILGAMLLKVIKEAAPETGTGRRYSGPELDYFWSRLAEHIDLLPATCHADVLNRRSSIALQRTIMREFGRRGVFTLSGRLRASASFAARHNSLFQGLAADGAKLALWQLWRAGYRIVNFIHDEIMVEVSEHSNLALNAEIVRSLMIEAMRQVVPDVRIDVQYTVSDVWTKYAEPVVDDQGRVAVWTARGSSAA
jgi:DNA polymerase I-like protein with 3'-5' exonuclease and polymerase domains